MTDRIQIAALGGSLLLLLLVLELVRRRHLSEEYSVIWVVSALGLIVVSLRRTLLDSVASWLGVYYPPAVLLLVLLAIVFVASLSFSVIVSRQQKQIDRLTEDSAILSAEFRALKREAAPGRRASGQDRQALGSGPERPFR